MKRTRKIKRLGKAYQAKGVVIGKGWGGCICAYTSRNVSAKSFNELRRKIKEMLEDGSLDSGFGFEKLYAAQMYIIEISMIEFEDKVYQHEEHFLENFFVKDCPKKVKEELDDPLSELV